MNDHSESSYYPDKSRSRIPYPTKSREWEVGTVTSSNVGDAFLKAMKDLVDAIKGVHREGKGTRGPVCVDCSAVSWEQIEWPCPTIAAVNSVPMPKIPAYYRTAKNDSQGTLF